MSDKHIKTVLPNRGNYWIFPVLFSPGAVGLPVIEIYRGGDLLNPDFLLLTGFAYAAIALMYVFVKAQKVVLGEDSISHRKLCFYKFVTKTFRYEELDYWRIERLTLVVARKDGKVPELPHGPFADLSDVLLIPSSLYSPRTKEITEFLTSKGVKKRR